MRKYLNLFQPVVCTLMLCALRAGEADTTATAPSDTGGPSFYVGASLMYASWTLSSKVDSDVNTIGNQSGRVDYHIDPSWVRTLDMSARWKLVRLGISVADKLRSEEAATYASLATALDVLVAEDRMLRLIYESGELHGNAEFHREDGYTTSGPVDTTWRRLGCLYGNGPWMAGLTYEDLHVPVAAGYVSHGKNIVYSDFLPDSRWRLFQIVGGYDHRQELAQSSKNYAGITGSFTAGFGYGWFTVPQSFVSAAEAATPFDADDDSSAFAISLDASLGYTVQGTIPKWGSGRLGIGMRGRWVYTTTSPILEDSNAPDVGNMWLLIQYQQLMWGPYLEASLTF